MISSSDAVYYTSWLSVVYDLKDRPLENLLVFSSKIEDLTFLTLVCLQTKGKRGKWLSFAPKPPVRKDKAYWWLFRRFRLQNRRWIYGFLGGILWFDKGSLALFLGWGIEFFCSQKRKSVDMVRLGFGEAISFSPSVSFTLMHVYMNTEIK